VEHVVAEGHAAVPPRAEPGAPVARLQAARVEAAVLLRAAPAEVAEPRQAELGEGAVLRAGAAARPRVAEGHAAVPPRAEPGAPAARPQVARVAAVLPWAAAWVFRRDRLRLAARRRSAPAAHAMRSLRTASP
jgi:hypothetical protein